MSKINELFSKNLKVINLGLESFSKDLKSQKITVVNVQWRPVAGGNKKLASILEQIS